MSGRSGYLALTILFSTVSSISADAAGFMIRKNSAATVGMSYAGTGSRAEYDIAADIVAFSMHYRF